MTDIKEYEGLYKITLSGDVWSHHTLNPRKLHQYNNKGYRVVWLVSDDKPRRIHYVHRLIAQAFLPNPNGLKEINHIDGNKSNNKLDNLEWCTRSQNILHAFNTGLKKPKRGKDVWNSKLTDTIVRMIREDLKAGIKKVDIGKKHGVSAQLIYQVGIGEVWNHVK